MDLETPDRTPVMCQLSVGHMLLQLGVSPAELWFDAPIYLEVLRTLREIYDFDGILISLHGHDPEWKKAVERIEQRNGGEEWIFWKNGDTSIFPPDDLPIHRPLQPVHPPPIEELDPLTLELPVSYIPVSQGLRFHIDPDHPYDAIRDLLQQAGEEYSIHSEVTSPFDYLLDLLGHEEALMALITNREKCLSILDRLSEVVEKIAREQAELGVDAIKLSSPYTGSGFISPDFYHTFVLPFESRIVKAGLESGTHVYVHTCGTISDRLELMIESGASGIECLDPPPLGDVNLEDAIERIGERAFIKGNLDSVNLLLKGSVEEVELEVERTLEKATRAKGFILSTACSVAPGVPRENLEVLARVARRT